MSKSQERKQNLYKKLRVCGIVNETLETTGWQEIIGPLIEKRINSVVGYKNEDEVYVSGFIDGDTNLEYYNGYRAGCMAIWNDIYNHKSALIRINKEIETTNNVEKDNSVTVPMEDTRYA